MIHRPCFKWKAMALSCSNAKSRCSIASITAFSTSAKRAFTTMKACNRLGLAAWSSGEKWWKTTRCGSASTRTKRLNLALKGLYSRIFHRDMHGDDILLTTKQY